jgi:antitoxin component of MazEF toxin-antitoxin module
MPGYKIEIRRIQASTGDRSLTLVSPKHFAVELGIEKGDYLTCQVEGNRLITIDRHWEKCFENLENQV